MRVAIVTTSYPAFEGDGSGQFVETEARRRALQDEVFVVTAGSTLAPPREETSRVYVLRLPGHGAFGWPGLAARVRVRPHRLIGAALWATRARATLVSLRPIDRIVAHWAVPAGWPISAGLGVPVELVSHGADVRALLLCPSPFRHAILGRLLRSADAWRFVSSSLLERLLRSLRTEDARKVARIARVEASPIDMPDVRSEAADKRVLHAGRRLAVCVARLVPSKRVDEVIDWIAGEPSPRSQLVVVGDGPLRTSLERHARAVGVDARFVGQTTRPVALAWIGAADVVLHASEAEGLSTVEREAGALGVPFRFVGTR